MADANAQAEQGLSGLNKIILDNGFVADGYQSGLFACLSDVESCALGCCCSAYLSARNVGNKEPGDGVNLVWWFVGCCGPLLTSVWVGRDGVQKKFGINSEEPIRRVVGAWFCGSCMVCQDAREIKLRSGVPLTSVAAATSTAEAKSEEQKPQNEEAQQ